MNRAPHPNAAKVFVNWLLSREGQTAFQRVISMPGDAKNSRRIDVPKDHIPVSERRDQGVKYFDAEDPDTKDITPAMKLMDEIFAGRNDDCGSRIYESSCENRRSLCVVFWTTAPHAAESKPNWQAEWERTVQAAKKEGSLSLYLFQGEGELGTVVQLFQKKYPEINVVTTLGRGNTLAPRIMAERRAGKYLVDIYISGVTTAYEVFYRAKILDSVRAALILPEVIDESKWWLGQHQYVDPENRYIFLYLGNVGEYVSYNTKAVEAGEIRSYWDFLQPKWKGKILSRDPKISGSQRIGLRMYYHTPELGAEFIRRLYGEMDVTLTQEIRQATDWLANGKFAICFFCSEILKVKGQGPGRR